MTSSTLLLARGSSENLLKRTVVARDVPGDTKSLVHSSDIGHAVPPDLRRPDLTKSKKRGPHSLVVRVSSGAFDASTVYVVWTRRACQTGLRAKVDFPYTDSSIMQQVNQQSDMERRKSSSSVRLVSLMRSTIYDYIVARPSSPDIGFG